MYECPGCAAGLVFDPSKQKVVCNHCNNEYTIEQIDKLNINSSKEDNNYNAITYRCTQCGAELITSDETIATFCSYCGSTALLEKSNTEKKKPDYIIPFKITKEECKKIYREKIKNSLLAPKNMIETQEVEKVRGIYIPYWVYSYRKTGRQLARGKKYKYRLGDYVYYNDYTISTEINTKLTGITHDASADFSDNLSEAISPFSIKDKKEFSPAYLTGFYADAEDVRDSTYMDEGRMIASNHMTKELMKDRTYRKYNSRPYVSLENDEIHLGLFPVYFLATKNKQGDRVSYAVINGQTGKVAAEIPIDFKKFIIISVFMAILIFILLNSFFTVTPIKVLILSIVFSILSLFVLRNQCKKIKKRESKTEDRGHVDKYLNNKNEYSKLNRVGIINKIKNTYKSWLGILIASLVLIIKPVSDNYYYLSALISILMVILSTFDMVKNYNLLTSRKLPHLEKRGGEENE